MDTLRKGCILPLSLRFLSGIERLNLMNTNDIQPINPKDPCGPPTGACDTQLLALLKAAYSVGFSHGNRGDTTCYASDAWRDNIEDRLEGGRYHDSHPLDFTTVEGWDSAY